MPPLLERDSRRTSRGSCASLAGELEDDLEELAAKAEREALQHTLGPHFVLIAVEHEINAASAAGVRKEMQDDEAKTLQRLMQGGRRRSRATPAYGSALASFLPNVVRRCIRHGLINMAQRQAVLESAKTSRYNPVLTRFPAAVVFADASGFTKLTESLARQPHGAELIGETLNGFFQPLIQIIHKHRGDVVKFSGDALTIVWPSEDPSPDPGPARDSRRGSGASCGSVLPGHEGAELDPDGAPARRARAAEAVAAAARCCLEIQQRIPSFNSTPLRDCSLTMHIGVGFGELALLQLGGMLGRWEFCVAGPALEQVGEAEALAASGETVLSPEARALASSAFRLEDVAAERCQRRNSGAPPPAPCGVRGAGFGRLLEPAPGSPTARPAPELAPESDAEAGARSGSFGEGAGAGIDWWGIEGVAGLDVRLLRRCIPSAVLTRLASSSVADAISFPEEMRRVSILFISLGNLDPHAYSGDGPWLSGARQTQLLMRLMQRSVYALEGSVNKFLVDDKGAVLLVVFGLPPLSHIEDDPIRAVLCAMRIRDTLRDEGLECRLGVATGQAWCGVVGSAQCREYTVLGDTVNLAARLMGKAQGGGVLVDAETQSVASRVGKFWDDGEVRMKGKQHPTRVYQFLGVRQGLSGLGRREPSARLRAWEAWPAHARLKDALAAHARRSGVIFIRGLGGVGKVELVEEVRAWAASAGRTALEGQNMDPSGIVAMGRLCLQEAFQELMRLASKSDCWRSQAWQLLLASLGEEAGGASCSNAGSVANGSQDSPRPRSRTGSLAGRRTSDPPPSYRRGPPTQAELHWIVIAMLRKSVGLEEAALLEPWAPLLSTVVTQLAFPARLVEALQERDEQNSRHQRFAEICAAVLDAFSSSAAAKDGTVVLLHFKRSTALHQHQDPQEASAVRAVVDLCMRRRAAAGPEGEARPLLLVVSAREDHASRGQEMLRSAACACGGMLDVEDLSPEQTTSFVDHCLQQPEGSAPAARWSVAAALQRRVSSKRCSSAEDPASPTKPRAGDGFSGRPARSRSEVPAALAEFAYDVTGGSPRGVLELLSEMERQQLLVPAGAGHLSLAKGCADARWLQDNMRPPQSLLARAFARFERLGPKQQAVLKVASSLERSFSVAELQAALGDLSAEEVQRVCAGLAERGSRALRRLPQPRPDGPERTEDDPPSSPRAPPVPRRVSRRASTAGVPRSPGGSDGASASPTRARQVSGTGVLGVAGAPGDRQRSGGRRASREAARRMDPRWGGAERFEFYSAVLRNVASNLVLESQRSHIIQRMSQQVGQLDAISWYGASTEESSSALGDDSDDEGSESSSASLSRSPSLS